MICVHVLPSTVQHVNNILCKFQHSMASTAAILDQNISAPYDSVMFSTCLFVC